MDRSIVARVIGFALIPVIVYGIMSCAMKEGEKEEVCSHQSARIIVRLPKVLWFIAIIGMLFYASMIMVLAPDETEPPFVFVFFSLAILFSVYILYISLVWRIEVPENEDFFILRDCWGKKHIIHYSDCVSYQYRRQEIIVRNRIKNFSLNSFLVNYAVFVAILNQHHVKRERDC